MNYHVKLSQLDQFSPFGFEINNKEERKMAYADFDYNLTDEQRAMRDMVRKFGAEVVRPAGIELDKMADPADVIAEGSVLWDVLKQARELGLHKTGFSKAIGGIAEDMDPMMGLLMSEEMGYADAGLAISMGVSGMPFAYCQVSPVPELQALARDFVADTECNLIGCWGITEPNHGGDWGLAGDDPNISPDLKGILKGDEYVLNGQKAAWVSNGTIATHTVLHVGLDPSRGMQGQGIAIVPLDLPGISRGKPLDKIGQRALNQGEIFFDDVQLPKEYMIIPDVQAMQEAARASGGRGGQPPMSGMAVLFGGLARAALDEGIAYAKQRIQGGVPIIEHKNIQLKLFEMFMKVESARSLARQQYMFNAISGTPSMLHVMAGKWMSTETAFQVASEAIQIHGGNGLSREYLIEKIFRDARAAMIEDGVNESLALGVVDGF
jgi:alkylation response protein AidB-like acyl-CoA dehydrogenase